MVGWHGSLGGFSGVHTDDYTRSQKWKGLFAEVGYEACLCILFALVGYLNEVRN